MRFMRASLLHHRRVVQGLERLVLQQGLIKREALSGGPRPLTIGLSRGVGFFEGQTILLFAKKIVKLVSHARAQYAMTFTSN